MEGDIEPRPSSEFMSSVQIRKLDVSALITWIKHNPALVPVVVALVGTVGAIVGGLFNILVWPAVNGLLGQAGLAVLSLSKMRRLEAQYLNWVVNEHRYLPVLPTTLLAVSERNWHAQPLDDVYVSLGLIGGEDTREGLPDALAGHNRIVVLGDPGAGKTTMARWVALIFAEARRASFKRADARAISSRRIVEEQFRLKRVPMPVFIYLNRLERSEKTNKTLVDLIYEEWKSVDALSDFPKSFLVNRVRKGECIFILDAFDELTRAESRVWISDMVANLVNSSPSTNRYVVTSRIVGYRGQLSKCGFSTYQVQRLSWDQVGQLVTNWSRALNKPALASPLLETLKSRPQIYELALNPMLLSIIVLVQYVRRLIPDQRHVLYAECINILVERRYAPPDVQESYNDTLPGAEAVRVIMQIAYAMHKTRSRDIARNVLVGEIIPNIISSMPASTASSRSANEILINIEQRSELLVNRGHDAGGQALMAFSHLTFQEYLTSIAIKDGTAFANVDQAVSFVISSFEHDPDWWQEVALLFAAQIEGRHRLTLMKALRPEGNN
jgi:predicted NACHT family NTPase